MKGGNSHERSGIIGGLKILRGFKSGREWSVSFSKLNIAMEGLVCVIKQGVQDFFHNY
jgi:hypothetical protein